ncbi:AAA family ATPase [Pseudomonas citronellolis]|uniref:AAA family ATPase n=1 Tax=Pseudomonas citronellolis TaxID=53408 RepID=UPI0023E3B166|nr:AAA family ATPase [Pseudomonas citronellolis]MDF3932217.1 AAA family ATPase [Pseudomonas citronellolis]
MKRTISLPVLDHLVVRHYPLYPGKDGQGLELNLKDGVSVLAGINGIGKTTLLNLLLRMLIGPADPRKAEQELGRVSKRDLTLPRKFDYFSLRVPDKLGEDATATLTFRIGTRAITVTRLMRDMALKSVTVDGAKLKVAGEIEFIAELANWAGIASAYDFHITVRYLQFFAEDRLPILWSPGTQFEFFKILFFESALQDELNEAFAQIQRVDTDYRNRKHQLEKREKELPPLPETSGISTDKLHELAGEAEKVFELADEESERATDQYQQARQCLFDADDALAHAETNLTQAEADFIAADAHYIAHCLPSLDDKLSFLMQGLGSSQGCFVCGTRGKKQHDDISKSLRQGHCFVCHSPLPADQQALSPTSASVVRDAEDLLERAHAEVNQARERREQIEVELKDHGEKMQQASSKRRVTLQQLEDYRRSIPSDATDKFGDVRSRLNQERKNLLALIAERDRHVEAYRAAVDKGQITMATLMDNLRQIFTNYAEDFLMEEVAVDMARNTPFKPATGAKKVNIPTFTVKMTSSTFRQPEARLSSNSVSESQKEFLDLAFRMAMLDLIAPGESMTVVVETPEASLDSWFMRRAAALMRRFTQVSATASRRLIATSNLNGTKMIPALLGILGDDNQIITPRPKNAGHLVNLLEETARPTVLREADATSLLEEEIKGYIA